MRRMYSEKELTNLIKEVVGDMIVDGDFSTVINDGIQAYMDAHPSLVLTSLETASLTATAINGESNPSVKPIYCHPIEIRDDTNNDIFMACLIFNNSETAIDTWDKLKSAIASWVASGGRYGLLITTGSFKYSGNVIVATDLLYDNVASAYYVRGLGADGNVVAMNIVSRTTITIDDGYLNKIN